MNEAVEAVEVAEDTANIESDVSENTGEVALVNDEAGHADAGANEPEEAIDDTPEWFMKDKYKSVDEQARAAFELQKKMGKYWGSPKENYNVEELGLDKDDPLLSGVMPAIKEMGISQEGFKHLVEKFEEANYSMAKKVEDELKKTLTVNDAMTYKAVDKWMSENLTEDEIKTVQNNWLMTPEDFKLFNQLRLMAAPKSSVPSQMDNHTVKFESSREVENDNIKYKKEVKEGHRVPDKNYEMELAQRFRDARSRELRSR